MEHAISHSRLTQFEKEFHNVLVQMFNHTSERWNAYPIKYNTKYNMDYTSFVKYCYSISSKKDGSL